MLRLCKMPYYSTTLLLYYALALLIYYNNLLYFLRSTGAQALQDARAANLVDDVPAAPGPLLYVLTIIYYNLFHFNILLNSTMQYIDILYYMVFSILFYLCPPTRSAGSPTTSTISSRPRGTAAGWNWRQTYYTTILHSDYTTMLYVMPAAG